MSQCKEGFTNEKWLEKDAYKSWLRKDDKNSNKVFCFACNKSIDLNVMGKSAMASHTKDDAQRIRKKSSRQWEGHKNIGVNRNIFLGFEVKLPLKKVLEKSLNFWPEKVYQPWTLQWTKIPSGGRGWVEILLVVSCYRNRY